MIGKCREEKIYTCKQCGFCYSNFDVSRVCSNCFACTGCEIYVCPGCGNEVVVKPIKSVAVITIASDSIFLE